jgi:uncharacterized protein YdhG (YjbR/CyaY superfamily)
MKPKGSKDIPKTIDQYLKSVPPDKKAALQKLRKDIHAAAPGIEECISYQMPAFRYDGRVIVYFAAAAGHVGFYPGGIVNEFPKELAKYSTSKGTIRYQPEAPLPSALVKKLVKARIAKLAPRQR